VESQRYAEFGSEKLFELGPVTVAKAWLVGAMINLASPAIVLSPPVSQLPRTGFYDTAGTGTAEKIINFLFRSDNALYSWITLAGIAGVVAIRVLQLIGLFALPWRRDIVAALLLLGLWMGFVLAINGPIASPKYRLPLEPIFALMSGAGYCAARDRLRRRRDASRA
jgi:hypothetical protein